MFLEESLSDVDKLWELQSVLSALNERERQMSVEPESFASVAHEYRTASEERTRLETQRDQLDKELRRVDGELSDQNELLKKYQGQLMQVKNQQQYAAAWKEIDVARKGVKDLEEVQLKSMGERETVQSQLDARADAHADLQSRYDAAHGEWQQSLGDLRKEAEQLRAKVAQVEATIPQRLRDEFYRIYKQRGQVAVTLVDKDTCMSCRTRVRPQVAQQLKRGEMVRCEGCHRILYLGAPTP